MPGLVGPAHPELERAETCGERLALALEAQGGEGTHQDLWKGPESPAFLHPSPNRCSGLKDSGSKELGGSL